MTILYANGCSMTYGSGLFDDTTTRGCLDHDARLRAAWPGRLGERLGVDRVVNDAVPGGSNDRIVRRTTEWVLDALASGAAPPDLLVVIGWSSPMRREFRINGVWRQLIPYHDYRDPDVHSLNQIYRDVAWDDGEGAARFALQVVLLQTLLTSVGVRHILFDALPASDTLLNAVASTATVQAIDARSYVGFRENGGDMSTSLRDSEPAWADAHPSAAGHDRWAGILAEALGSRAEASGAPSYEGTREFVIIDVKTDRSRRAPDRSIVEPKRRTLRRIAQAFAREPFIYD